MPEDLPGEVEDITIDGQHLILRHTEQDLTEYPIPTTKDVESINHYFSRPRRGRALGLPHRRRRRAGRSWRRRASARCHLDTSPADPALIRYCLDMPDAQASACGRSGWTAATAPHPPAGIRRDGHP